MNRSVKKTVLIRALILILLVSGLWFLLLSPRLGEPERIRQQAVSVDDQVTALQNEYMQLRDDEGFQQTITSINDQLNTSFPSRADVPGLVEQISRTATAAGLSPTQVLSVAPEDPVVAGAGAETAGTENTEGNTDAAPAAPAGASSYATMKVVVTVQGTLRQIASFVNALGDQDRGLFLDEVAIEPGDGELSVARITATSLLLSPLERPQDTAQAPSPDMNATEPTVPTEPTVQENSAP